MSVVICEIFDAEADSTATVAAVNASSSTNLPSLIDPRLAQTSTITANGTGSPTLAGWNIQSISSTVAACGSFVLEYAAPAATEVRFTLDSTVTPGGDITMSITIPYTNAGNYPDSPGAAAVPRHSAAVLLGFDTVATGPTANQTVQTVSTRSASYRLANTVPASDVISAAYAGIFYNGQAYRDIPEGGLTVKPVALRHSGAMGVEWTVNWGNVLGGSGLAHLFKVLGDNVGRPIGFFPRPDTYGRQATTYDIPGTGAGYHLRGGVVEIAGQTLSANLPQYRGSTYEPTGVSLTLRTWGAT